MSMTKVVVDSTKTFLVKLTSMVQFMETFMAIAYQTDLLQFLLMTCFLVKPSNLDDVQCPNELAQKNFA